MLDREGSSNRITLSSSFLVLLLAGSFLLSLPCNVFAQLDPADRAALSQQTGMLVRVGKYDEALELFRRLVYENPDDFESRNWVARLESWKGNVREAEQLYREILEEAPGDLEAQIGLIDVLSWEKRYTEALDRLRDLEAFQPHNTEVLLRLGKIFWWQRNREEALKYFEQVLALHPSNSEALESVETLKEQESFQVEVGYLIERFDVMDDAHGQFLEFQYRDYDRISLLTRLQHLSKFEEQNTRLTLGGTARLWQRTWLHGNFSRALSHDNKVIANQDYAFEIVQGVAKRISLGGGYRFLNFQGAEVQSLTGLLDWSLGPRIHLYFRYIPARTRFKQPAEGVWNHGGWAQVEWETDRFLRPYVLFAVNNEVSNLSNEQLGHFAAQTYGGGTEIHLSPIQGLRIGSYFQNRTQEHWAQFFTLSYFFRF